MAIKGGTVLNKVAMAEGSSVYTTVVSNEVVQAPNQYDAFMSCGGTNLYLSITETLNSEKIVSTVTVKSEGPLR